MKKIAFLIFCALSSYLFAQNNRFIYLVQMRPDAQDKSNIITEKAHLDVSSGKSIFYGERRLLRDSLASRMQATGNWDRAQFQDLQSQLNYIIEKDLASQTITYKDRIGRDNYEYPEDRKMNWKIFPDTKKIGEYKVQKAETDFGGRTWAAWFATELPFQDGPYKFAGLPGLIIKVEDSAGDFNFELMQTKKIDAPVSFPQRGNSIKVKRGDFNRQKARYEKDPAAALAGGARGGRPVNPQRAKEMEKRLKEEISKNNNPIEKE